MNIVKKISTMACRARSRQAMSLIELILVVAVIGVLAAASISTFGHGALAAGGAEGYARKLALSLVHARRATIATGDNHYINFNTSGGDITSFTLFRRASGGDVPVDQPRSVPNDVSVASSSNVLEFDFQGAALLSYSVTITGPERNWSVLVDLLTGSVRVTEV